MLFKTLIFIFYSIFLSDSIASAYNYSSAFNDVERVGYLQPLLITAICKIGSECDNDPAVDEMVKKSVDCLAEIKSNTSFCNTFVKHFETCTKSLVTKIENDCVERKLKGVPTALVKSLVSQMDFICNTDGEHILELLNPCVYNSFKSKDRECFKDLKKLEFETAPLMSLICDKFVKLKNCFEPTIKENCQNEITRNTISELYNSNYQASCNGI